MDALKDDTYGSPAAPAFASYKYDGAGRIIIEDYTQAEVRLDYEDDHTDPDPGAGEYEGFDRFGRVWKQVWYDHGASEERDKFSYGYDRNSSRLYRKNEHTNGGNFSELYHANDATANQEYDGLNRLKEFRRGPLDNPPDSIPDDQTKPHQVFTLDQVGNWAEFKVDEEGNGGAEVWDLDQNRAHNKANEIADHGGDPIWPETSSGTPNWQDPTYDARGNTTKVPVPGDEVNHYYTLTYDAWNRMVKVKNDTPATVAEYRYDGTGRRIRKSEPETGNDWTVREYYYNNAWQLLEIRKDTKTRIDGPPLPEPDVATKVYEQYVWSVRYIDAPVLRDRDTTGNGDLDERLYYLNDANMNVTALVEDDGDIAERYVYDPYGRVAQMYSDDWSTPVAWGSSKKNEVLYCGYRFDHDARLYHVRNRAYHPTLGRWGQRDPSGYADGMSLYEYVGGNPTAHVDPTGLWWPKRHREITDHALGTILGKLAPGPMKKCKKYITKTLKKANAKQDKGAGKKEQKRHYNRDYVRGETAAVRLANRQAADAAYKGYIDHETAEFHRQLKAGSVDCNGALWAQGRRDHSLQDFYMHAIRRDGRGGPENATGPGWTAWSDVPAVTGTPDKRDKFWPSSYNATVAIYEGEHPNTREPVLYSSCEGVARLDAAKGYMVKEYATKIPAWWKVCCAWCNKK